MNCPKCKSDRVYRARWLPGILDCWDCKHRWFASEDEVIDQMAETAEDVDYVNSGGCQNEEANIVGLRVKMRKCSPRLNVIVVR